jgi:hypothetical protein
MASHIIDTWTEIAWTPELILEFLTAMGFRTTVKPWPAAAPSIVFAAKGNEHNSNKVYIIKNVSYPENIKPIGDWIRGLDESDIDNYYQLPNQDSDFWADVSPVGNYILYHRTSEANAKRIVRSGLEPRSESRGVSNRGIGAAVFLGPDPDSLDAYGDVLFAVNMSAMKRDGYTPPVQHETGVDERTQREALAHSLQLDDYYEDDTSSEGIYDDTVVVSGHIPAKYVKRLE